MSLHPHLRRQLRRMGADAQAPPDAETWQALLGRVSSAYETADRERYLLERSFTISTAEMQDLHTLNRRREAEQVALRRIVTAAVAGHGPEEVRERAERQVRSLLGPEAEVMVAPAEDAAPRVRAGQLGSPFNVRGGPRGIVAAPAPGDEAARAEVELALRRLADVIGVAMGAAHSRQELEERAVRDPLTGLANHREFHERLGEEVARARAEGRDLSLIVLDLDHFKQINDIHGHSVGDVVLTETARRLAATARDGDLVARVGGEEFAWILPGVSGPDAYLAGERARAGVRERRYDGVGRILTASVGVCDLEWADSPDELFRLADGALYWAKSRGRDMTVLYTPDELEGLSTESRAAGLERAEALHALRALARAIDAKDHYTREHSERVADLAVRLAVAMGWGVPEAARLHEAGLVHDVGKIGISDAILLKPGRLTDDEYTAVREHAALGARIVSEVLAQDQVGWVAHHHERWDGRGYPDGIAGLEIPEGARILALADAWDAMTSARGYGSELSCAEALAECRRSSGTQFWPQAVSALERLVAAGALGPIVPEGLPSDAAEEAPLPAA